MNFQQIDKINLLAKNEDVIIGFDDKPNKNDCQMARDRID